MPSVIASSATGSAVRNASILPAASASMPGLLGLESDEGRVLDLLDEVDARDHQGALEVRLDRAARARPDLLAVEVGRLRGRRILGDEEALGHVVIGLGHVQVLHPGGVDGTRAVGDIEPIAPAAGRHLGPGRLDEAGLDTQRLGDELGRLDVETGHLAGGDLGRLALGVRVAGRAVDLDRLRRVVQLGIPDERAAPEDLGELVLGRIGRRGLRWRRRRGTGADEEGQQADGDGDANDGKG